MFSKRSLEGEIFIDHRASPGLTPDQAGRGGLAVAGGQVYESATYVCSHCQMSVVINPLRTRERGWCSKCDRYLCDECEGIRSKTFECHSVARLLDEIQEACERSGVSPLLLKT